MSLPRPTGALVIVVGLLKGGVGKTKLAMLIALYLAVIKKKRVLLVDADSVSQTAYDWVKAARRAGIWPATVEAVRHPFEDVDELIDDRAGDVDVVVVDVGGGDRQVFEAAASRAHKVLVPVGADRSETKRLPATWKSAAAAARASTVGGFTAYVVLSRTDRGSKLRRECREELVAADYPVTKTEMVKRVAYQRIDETVPVREQDYLDVPDLLVEVGIIDKKEIA